MSNALLIDAVCDRRQLTVVKKQTQATTLRRAVSCESGRK